MHAVRLVAFAAILLAWSPARADDPPIQVMVLGVYHFDNPGRDIHNTKVDDVTVPKRQAELADVSARLARFKPTRIALEAETTTASFAYDPYRKFKLADLATKRDERIQIGFRIAHDTGLTEVYGIDADGDFPYEKLEAFAGKTPAGKARLAALNHLVEASVTEFTALQKTATTAQLLAYHNDPARIRGMHGFYYGVLGFGDAKAQPGAELNAGWYARNARIFAKLTQIAKPGDRVIVVFGAGHAYWLRHFVETTPGFQLVEPNGYLTAAK